MTRCLSFHAGYRCRHSGDCCTAGWPIPDDKGGLLPRTERGCAFHNSAAHRCDIQTAHGHDALPLACRQFPRVTITDPRGVSIALSCYCPTALDQITAFNDRIEVVDNPPAFPAAGEYVGLDARTSLPPALCPDILMDWDSWWEWERLSVDLCNLGETPRQLLARLSIAVEHARTWRPGQGELIERVREAQARARALSFPGPEGPGLHLSASEIKTDWRAGPACPAERRFLACHMFANWTGYLGQGLRTWLRSIETLVFLMEAGWTIKEIDLWLRHYANPQLLARVWSEAERG